MLNNSPFFYEQFPASSNSSSIFIPAYQSRSRPVPVTTSLSIVGLHKYTIYFSPCLSDLPLQLSLSDLLTDVHLTAGVETAAVDASQIGENGEDLAALLTYDTSREHGPLTYFPLPRILISQYVLRFGPSRISDHRMLILTSYDQPTSHVRGVL